MEDVINQNVANFTSSQIKFLCKTNEPDQNWLYLYSLKYRESSWRRLGFFVDFISRDVVWKNWALEEYGRRGILEVLPNSLLNVKPVTDL